MDAAHDFKKKEDVSLRADFQAALVPLRPIDTNDRSTAAENGLVSLALHRPNFQHVDINWMEPQATWLYSPSLPSRTWKPFTVGFICFLGRAVLTSARTQWHIRVYIHLTSTSYHISTFLCPPLYLATMKQAARKFKCVQSIEAFGFTLVSYLCSPVHKT